MSNRYLFVTWDGAGNAPVELAVIRELTDRGHHVTVLADPTLRAEAELAGAAFRPWVDAPHLKSRAPEDDYIRDYELKTPPQNVARLCQRLIAEPAAVQARETAAAIGDLRPDVVIVDAFLLGPQIAAEAERLPVVALCPNIYPLPAPGIPPFGTGWQPARGPLGRLRDGAVTRIGARLWSRSLPPVNAVRRAHGLPALGAMWDQLDRAQQVLVLSSPQFDFPGRLPDNVSYAGPRLADPAWVGGWEPPAGEEPLVLISLSSGAQGQRTMLQTIADALGQLAVRALITTGHGVAPDEIVTPANVVVRRSAPHNEVLRHAAVVVDHGGHGTVCKTLAAGVPQLVIPMGRDQLDNAARVVARGAGLRLKPSASPDRIAGAIRRLIEEPSFRGAAQRLGAQLRSEAGSDHAVRVLENAAAAHRAREPSMSP